MNITTLEREITAAAERPGRPYSWYVLAILFAVYVMNMADRQLVGILAEDIKRDLQLSDSQIGILAGPAIAFFYAVLGVPMAYAADRINRVRFISACLVVWSVMTMLGGRAANMIELAATRVGVSVAEAGGSPSSVSLIADYFGPRQRATAMAIWTAGSTVGIFVGFALGGVVNEQMGWRDTFIAAGIPGIILAIIMMVTVHEPMRGAADDKPVRAAVPSSRSMIETFRHLWRITIFRQCILASAMCNFCVFAVLTWAPPFAVRRFGVGTAEVGTIMGSGIALAGGSMMILSGIMCDLLGRKSQVRPLVTIAAMLLISATFLALSLFASSFSNFAILFTIGYATLMTNPPITWVILQASSPPEMRAMATALLLLTIAFLASIPAPLLVGMVSDALEPSLGANSLSIGLLLAPMAVLAAAALFLRAALTAHREDQSPADHGIGQIKNRGNYI